MPVSKNEILKRVGVGFSDSSVGKESPAMQETPVWFLSQGDPLERDRLPTPEFLGFPVSQLLKNPPAMWDTWVRSLGWEDPLEKGMATTPVFWPGEFHGQRIPAGYSPRGRKESDMTEQLSHICFFLYVVQLSLLIFYWWFMHQCSGKRIICGFLFFVLSLSGLGVRVILTSYNELRSVPYASFSWRRL